MCGILRCWSALPTFALITVAMAGDPANADLWGTSLDPKGTQTGNPNYNKVYRYDLDGDRIEPDIDFDFGATSPFFPTGITTGPTGNLYVSNYATGNIKFYDGQTGAPLTAGANPLSVFSQFTTSVPAQLVFGPDGNVYVSEFFGTNVLILDPVTGEQIGVAAEGLVSAGGLAFGPDGALYIGDGFQDDTEELPPATIVRVLNGEQETWSDGNSALQAPSTLHFLPNGHFLVADVFANRIWDYAPDGSFSEFAEIYPEIPEELPPGATYRTNSPSDIEFDERGNLIVSVLGLTDPPDNRGALLRYALDGTFIETITDGLEPVGGITWTPSVNTLAGDYDHDTEVDEDDYTFWKADYGKWVARGNGADGNADGIVDAADYTVWRNHFVEGGGGQIAQSSQVPEPAGAALLLVGLAIASCGRRKS